jgi:hypothetical protein
MSVSAQPGLQALTASMNLTRVLRIHAKMALHATMVSTRLRAHVCPDFLVIYVTPMLTNVHQRLARGTLYVLTQQLLQPLISTNIRACAHADSAAITAKLMLMNV